jgi:predicted N-formylglutamate amidohydrolase
LSEVPPSRRLLAPDEPAPVRALRRHGASPFLLTADHAGALIPRRLGALGLPESERRRHIAWDIGIAETTELLSGLLDACAVLQTYSRLVIDCNRQPGTAGSIAWLSETTTIEANRDLSAAERKERQREIFVPYHAAIAELLDRRLREAQPTILVAMHSFTPVFKGVERPMHIGVLYNRDPLFAGIVLDLLRQEGDLIVGDNQPYRVSDETDYGIPVHGERRGLPHVEIEIRQDLIAESGGQRQIAERLARLLRAAAVRLQRKEDS